MGTLGRCFFSVLSSRALEDMYPRRHGDLGRYVAIRCPTSPWTSCISLGVLCREPKAQKTCLLACSKGGFQSPDKGQGQFASPSALPGEWQILAHSFLNTQCPWLEWTRIQAHGMLGTPMTQVTIPAIP